jgi:signal transduction histidine kinase
MSAILWVDDEPLFIKPFASRIEAELSVKIEFAANIAFAFEKIESKQFDVILIDIKIPVGSLGERHRSLEEHFESKDDAGFGFLAIAADERRRMVSNLAEVSRIIICTSYSQNAFERFSKPGGKFAIFPKPSLLNELPALIELIRGDRGQSATLLVEKAKPPIGERAASSRQLLDITHELRRTLLSCVSLVGGAQIILTGQPPEGQSAKTPAELRGIFELANETLNALADEYVDRRLSIPEAKAMDDFSSVVERFKKDTTPLSLTKRTLLVDHIWSMLRSADRVGSGLRNRTNEALRAVIDQLMLVDITELFSRLQHGLRLMQDLDSPSIKLGEEVTEFRPSAVLQEVANYHVILARERRLEIRTRLECDDVICRGDANAFKLIIENLLDNAIKYSHQMRRELAWIELKCSADDREFGIVVENWGARIEQDEQGKVIQAGIRGRHADRPGTGRGLAIVSQQLAKLGGRLAITSERSPDFKRRKSRARDEAYVNTISIYIPRANATG